MQTSIRVDSANRDALVRVAEELGGVSLDDALRAVLWQRQALVDIAALEADPVGLADYRREGYEWAELDLSVEVDLEHGE